MRIDEPSDMMFELRERSGNYKTTSRLVAFLYELMRDEVPTGVVERILQSTPRLNYGLTNGYLAKYSEYVAERLLLSSEEPI